MLSIILASYPAVAALAFFLGDRRPRRTVSKSLPVLQDIASDLLSSSQQVTSISKDLSNASQEQLESLSSTISASHEIRSMVESTTENTTRVASESTLLQEMAKNGGASSQKWSLQARRSNRELRISALRCNRALSSSLKRSA